jgi:hypothetical protein
MTIAQVRQERLRQLRKVIAALRTYDSKQENLERILKRYRSKRTLIESNDMPAINAAFSAMNAEFSKIENELMGLYRLVGT